MSDTSQGPGWWIASDGKWYPPEQAAGAAPTQPVIPPPVPPQYTPAPGATTPGQPVQPPPAGPAAPAPMPPAKKSGAGTKGCIIALAVVGFIILLGGLGLFLALGVFASKVKDAATAKQCTYLSNSQAKDAVGGDPDVVQLTGFVALGNIVLDTRVLPDGDGCWIQQNGSGNTGYTGRTAKATGGKSAYEAALTQARGTTQDRGNGLSVETMGYYLKDVDGVGDEAFCTSPELTISSGVLVRKGDTLVYVSVMGTNPDQASSADQNCDVAVKVAKKILG